MKPAICCICGNSSLDESCDNKGDWVEFKDYQQDNSGNLSHPDGLEYFCSEHLYTAKSLAYKFSNEAVIDLKKQWEDNNALIINSRSSWWQRLFKKNNKNDCM